MGKYKDSVKVNKILLGKKLSRMKFVVQSIICCFLSIWIIDLLVIYVRKVSIFPDENKINFFKDHINFLLAESHIGLYLILISFILSSLLFAIFKSSNFENEFIILISTNVLTLQLITGFWIDLKLKPSFSIFISTVIGLIYAIFLRYFVYRYINNIWTFNKIFYFTLYPGLILGFIKNLKIIHKDLISTAINIILIFILLSVGFVNKKLKWNRLRRFIYVMPFSLTIFIIALLSFQSLFYGTNIDVLDKREEIVSPNIVLIVLDGVGANHLKMFGYQRDTMPALEKWARKGLTAKKAVANCTGSTPSYASIFSGRTVSGHGVHKGLNVFQTKPFKGINWLPQILAQKNYYCVSVNSSIYTFPQESIGFHKNYSPDRITFEESTASLDTLIPSMTRLSEKFFIGRPILDSEGIVKIAKRVISKKNTNTFLLVTLSDSGYLYNPPQTSLESLNIKDKYHLSSAQKYLLRRDEKILYRQKFPLLNSEHLNDMYDGSLRWIDTNLEELLNEIKLSLGDNTYIIVTSVHGQELGEYGVYGHATGISNRIIHVPLFISGPGINEGSIEEVVTLRKLYDFIISCSSKEGPQPNLVTQKDEFGIISERYKSGYMTRDYGPDVGRAWVSLIEGKYKVVGPSENGFQVYDISHSMFKEKLVDINTPEIEKMKDKINYYWTTYRDRREE